VPDPGDLLALTNEDLAADNPEMTFITAALGVVDTADGTGRICVAGHEAPLFLGEAGVETMGGYRIQPALGIIEGISYTSVPFALAPGQALLLLSDGVTEAQDHDGNLFGKERVLAALDREARPAPAITALLAAVAGFVQDAPPADDVTVLALRLAP
jgi:serine phosphatase RsbU (regulator of sigma subunit)